MSGRAKRAPRRAGGVTLVEMIAAMVILSVAVPPTLWAVRQAQLRRLAPVHAERARWLAIERLEGVIADHGAPTRGYAFVQNAAYPDEAALAGFPGFSRRVRIVETGPDLATSGADCKTVTVTVEYDDPAVGRRSVVLSTVLAKLTP